MKPEPLPCSNSGRCGPKRGKNRSIPGGSRRWATFSVRWDLMYTTLGRTWSATAANASLRSTSGLAAGMLGACTGGMAAANVFSWADERLGRSNSPANSRPNAKASATRPPNFNQFNDRDDIDGPWGKAERLHCSCKILGSTAKGFKWAGQDDQGGRMPGQASCRPDRRP